MKTEMIVKSHWQIAKVYFFELLFSAVVLISFLCLLVPVRAQPDMNKSGLSAYRMQIRFGLNKRQLNQLLPVIGKQTASLQKIYTKYSEKAAEGFYPFWTDANIWDDLERNRHSLASDLTANITKRQGNALRAVYMVLEKETLLLLLDEQILIWGGELDLTGPQFDDIYDIVTRDINKKQSIMNRQVRDRKSAGPRLKAIGEETEKSIWNVLFPEQRAIWERRSKKAKQDGARLRA